jgi:exodeoxyribonuclease VII large subunit
MPAMSDHITAPERTVYTVAEFNQTIRGLLESEFPLIWIEGEISNLAQPASGHMYFSLKDDRAQVRCAMFRGRNQFLGFKPHNGQQVRIRAKVSLYEARGEFQLIAEHMEDAGLGALQQAFDALKAKLAAEGLFDEDLKLPIPEFPQRVGVITSPTGAAIRDVLSVLRRRFPGLPVLVYPVPVQGEGAAQKIAATLALASKRKDCDVLLLVRGGGSLEDLWSFNEEIVARAVVACKIPVICGVGHEIDFSIADFAADLRAPTPSAAAELISPDRDAWLQEFDWYQQRLAQLVSDKIERLTEKLGWLRMRLQQRHPLSLLEQQSQRLDDLQQRLITAWQYQLRDQESQLHYLMSRLLSTSPEHRIELGRQQLEQLGNRLQRAMTQGLSSRKQQLALLSRTMQAVSPLQTLARGYAIASDGSGQTLTRAEQVQPGDSIQLRLHRGRIFGRVEKTQKR